MTSKQMDLRHALRELRRFADPRLQGKLTTEQATLLLTHIADLERGAVETTSVQQEISAANEALRKYVHEQLGFLTDDDNRPAEALLRMAAAKLRPAVEPTVRCTCFEDEHGPDCDKDGCCGQCKGSRVKATASLPACECLVRDKSPSAYHNVKCPRYVADLL